MAEWSTSSMTAMYTCVSSTPRHPLSARSASGSEGVSIERLAAALDLGPHPLEVRRRALGSRSHSSVRLPLRLAR
jgi:hypothetical protein